MSKIKYMNVGYYFTSKFRRRIDFKSIPQSSAKNIIHLEKYGNNSCFKILLEHKRNGEYKTVSIEKISEEIFNSY